MQVVNKAFYAFLVANLPESAKLADERMRRIVKERQRAIETWSARSPKKEVAKELKAEHKIEILDEATNEAAEVETWTVRLTPIDGVSSHRETGVVRGFTYPTRKR